MNAFHPFRMNRRLRVARGIVWGTLGVIVLGFFRAQILEHGRYELKSRTNRLKAITLPAPRGVITDRHGAILAENVPGYTVSLLPASTAAMRAMLWRMAPIVKLDSAAITRILARYQRAPYQPALVLADAPFRVVSTLEERRLLIPGLVIQTEPKRHYPDSGTVAHLMGYVGEVTEQELARRRTAGLGLGALVGQDGLEREYDDSLRGADGVRFVEVSALGHVVRDHGASPTLRPVSGAPLRTTIDLELQRYVARIFPAG
jgi:penicillin-binding protein 2